MAKHNEERPNMDTSRLSPISYSYAHKKLTRARGRAADMECVGCGRQASQWAYQYNSDLEQSEERHSLVRGKSKRTTVYWSADVQSYAPMCVPCHKEFDREQEAAREL